MPPDLLIRNIGRIKYKIDFGNDIHMNKTKALYFLLSLIILVLAGIMIAYEQQPNEVPVIKNISEADISETSENTISCETFLNYADISEIESTVFSETSVSTYQSSDSEKTVEFPIDLNKATKDELMMISGIGEVLSDRIIEYRNMNGGFSSVNQLAEVKGIGDKRLEQFRSFLYVENEQDYPQENSDDDEYYEYIPEVNYDEDYYEEETEEPEETEQAEIYMVEMNSATAEDFMQLPGIDEDTAYKIIEFREKIHYFSHPYELAYLDEISDSLLASILDYLYIEGKEDIIY